MIGLAAGGELIRSEGTDAAAVPVAAQQRSSRQTQGLDEKKTPLREALSEDLRHHSAERMRERIFRDRPKAVAAPSKGSGPGTGW